LKELRESEMWQAGKTVRSLRPENQAPAGSTFGASEKPASKLETVK
jgi:ketol-acid reductoisomerase